MNNQMNSAVRKIHNLLSSGAVTVTGPNQPRILKQKVGSTTLTSSSITGGSSPRCYICDDAPTNGQAQHPITEMSTTHTGTKYPNKIGQLVGDAFLVIVSLDDVVCARCSNLLNYLDRLENDVERVRTNLLNLLHKKYGLNDEGGGGSTPPNKMLKLNSGTAVRTVDEGGDVNRTRKLFQSTTGVESPLGKQSPPVSAVQQIKISTQPTMQHQISTQTMHRKPTRIYKCTSCDYKTSDMRLFNTHYESCKQQSFQCKNCKKIFSNFGSMKQHMVREHNTSMDNTCAVCHINFVSEIALRKHMELNHSTNVLVTSTATLPAGSLVSAMPEVNLPTTNTTPLYTCNNCQFKSIDKVIFDDHMRKHLSAAKPKPFKCRLCAQRFETREAATIHAKQHQPNYFKCGTCSMSFPKREMLVKHFEQHHPVPSATTTQQTATQSTASTVKQQQQQVTGLTTQKLLQETIDEALSESGVANATAATEPGTTTSNNIQFFSCHICSLTFIQENYYNQHMETHRPEKKGISISSPSSVTVTTAAHTTTSSATSLNSSASLISDGLPSVTVVKSEANNMVVQQSNSHSVDADIESIFEKMHSDKGELKNSGKASSTSAANTTTTTNTSSTAGGGQGNENLIITSQQGSSGITFNITIPRDAAEAGQNSKTKSSATTPVSVGIDMPMLDQPDESVENKNDVKLEKETKDSKASSAAPVSMPSLDDENDSQDEIHQSSDIKVKKKEKMNDNIKIEHNMKEENSSITDGHADSQESASTSINDSETGATESGSDEHQQVAMEMDEAMQEQVESGQIKFILNENGQLLQLDNHILTDADGNQILVQDPEQIQQLLQSVGVLHSGDGLDGETIQMMTDGNGQMVLVQGENNETQLIDASLLNASGQLVLHGQDGELGEGAHVIGEDGRRIPVSVSYTADGQPIVQVQQEVLESGEGVVLEKDTAAGSGEDSQSDGGAGTSSGGFFALEDLMQRSSEAKSAE